MNKEQLKALAKEATQGLNSEEDITALTKLLRQSFYGNVWIAVCVITCLLKQTRSAAASLR